jgi:DNA (cytosine-5)-methyltransferase 1
MNFKFIDLFCGIGGFHQAMRKMGGTCVFASDINKDARYSYQQNYDIQVTGDIRKINEKEMPEFDVLCAGFPCQPFSNAGKKKAIDDTRGTLFHDILRIAREKRPRVMILENVKHIMKIGRGEVFRTIIKAIEESGYNVNTTTLSPHQLGIPQQRERVIFLCVRSDCPGAEDIPIILPPKNSKIDCKSILEKGRVAKKYYVTGDQKYVLDAWDEMIGIFEDGEKLSPTILVKEFYSNYTDEEFASLPKWKQDYMTKNRPIYEKYKDQWDAWFDKHKHILQKREIYMKLEWQAGKKQANDSIWKHFISFRQSGIRVKKAKYFPTLVAIVQTPVYGPKKRFLTPRECARLQSFPDSFICHENDHKAYKQFGNAVNVDVIHYASKEVIKKYITSEAEQNEEIN